MPRVRFQRSHGILGHSKKIMLPFIWFDSPSLRDGVKKILAQPYVRSKAISRRLHLAQRTQR